MIKFENRIVQFGFGAVGKSFFEKVSKEIDFDINNYFVISKDKLEYTFFLELGGKLGNFIVENINRTNFKEIFSKYLTEGDILIDFADDVGTRDFVEWCAYNNIMYLNTGETDWSDHWYNIFEENLKKNELRKEVSKNTNINKYPIVLHHGNNPGLVSHFVKAGIEYIVKNQFKNNERLNQLLSENKFNEIAKEIKLKEIHVNDNDFQEVKDEFYDDKLYSTWSIDSFFFEMLSEATMNLGTNEEVDIENCKNIDIEKGFLEFNDIALEKLGKTYYPKGKFEAFLVPHEETITIAQSLEVKDVKGNVIYRPTVMFLYSPCEYAVKYLKSAKINNNGETDEKNQVIKGFKYPKKTEIIYKENIKNGTEYVGVLLLGSKFEPVWVGNRIKKRFLYKNKKTSFWQTPTITPVSMSALSAFCWMIKNKEKGGIYFPDDINDYKEIINLAEKYISKTIYKTFSKEKLEKAMEINIDNLHFKDILF